MRERKSELSSFSHEALRAPGSPPKKRDISPPLLFSWKSRLGKVKLLREQVEREASSGDSDNCWEHYGRAAGKTVTSRRQGQTSRGSGFH